MSYHDYISEATLNYLMQQYPEHTPGWLETFTDEVHRLEEMWGVQVEGYERDSRFGTILYGQSSRYGKVAVKISTGEPGGHKAHKILHTHYTKREKY